MQSFYSVFPTTCAALQSLAVDPVEVEQLEEFVARERGELKKAESRYAHQSRASGNTLRCSARILKLPPQIICKCQDCDEAVSYLDNVCTCTRKLNTSGR